MLFIMTVASDIIITIGNQFVIDKFNNQFILNLAYGVWRIQQITTATTTKNM